MHWAAWNYHREVWPTVTELYLSNPGVFEDDFLKDNQLRLLPVEQSEDEALAVLFLDHLESPDIRWSVDIVSID